MEIKAKVLPANTEAEQSVLGSIFLDNALIIKVRDQLEITDFYEDRHKIIYDAMIQVYEEGNDIDYTTITETLTKAALAKKIGGMDYLSEIANIVPTSGNIDSYIEIVRNLSIKRNLMDAATEILESGYDGNLSASDYVDFSENLIQEVSKRRKSSQFLHIKDVAKEVLEIVEMHSKRDSSITGLATKFKDLDERTLGLQPEELIILAARPAMGKSAFALNLAVNVAKNNKNGKAGVAVFSLEMAATQLVARMLSSESGIENSKIKSGNLTNSDFRMLQTSEASLGKLNIYFDDASGVTINDLRNKCRNLHQEGNLDLVIIDYLQLLSGDARSGNRQEEVSKISRTLKHMARELKIPVIALSQLSRAVEHRENKTPVMADLRESGSIEQDADIIMFLYREEYYKKDSPRIGEADVIIGKNRSGQTGDFTLIFSKEYSKFDSKTEVHNEYYD